MTSYGSGLTKPMTAMSWRCGSSPPSHRLVMLLLTCIAVHARPASRIFGAINDVSKPDPGLMPCLHYRHFSTAIVKEESECGMSWPAAQRFALCRLLSSLMLCLGPLFIFKDQS